MEAERKKNKTERQVAQKNTAYAIKERKAKESAKAREKSPELMAMYDLFLPGAGNKSRPKYITDKYGNRVRSGQEGKKK